MCYVICSNILNWRLFLEDETAFACEVIGGNQLGTKDASDTTLIVVELSSMRQTRFRDKFDLETNSI